MTASGTSRVETTVVRVHWDIIAVQTTMTIISLVGADHGGQRRLGAITSRASLSDVFPAAFVDWRTFVQMMHFRFTGFSQNTSTLFARTSRLVQISGMDPILCLIHDCGL